MKKATHFLHTHYKVLIVIMVGFIGLEIGYLTHQFFLAGSDSQVLGSADTAEPRQVVNTPTPIPTPPDTPDEVTIALLGKGGPGHEGGHLTDVIQLAHFNLKDKKLALISIPRDLWVPVPSGNYNKINALFAQQDGSSEIKHSLTQITGLPVHYAAAIDFVGFQRLIGIELGGIEVEVPETFEDAWYPIRGREQDPCGHTPEEIATLTNTLSGFALEKQFECRYEHLYFEKGTVKMEGGDALAYVRSRHSSSDFARSARQHAVMEGIKQKLFSLDIIDDIPAIYETVTTHVETDFDLDAAKKLGPALLQIQDYKISSLVLSTENVFVNGTGPSGQFILQPKEGISNWDGVISQVQQHISAE